MKAKNRGRKVTIDDLGKKIEEANAAQKRCLMILMQALRSKNE